MQIPSPRVPSLKLRLFLGGGEQSKLLNSMFAEPAEQPKPNKASEVAVGRPARQPRAAV
jgi:hypothetical protein